MIEILSVLAIVYFITYLANVYLRYRLEKLQAQLVEQLAAEYVIPSKLEKHHGCYYLFRCDNDAFVCQGWDANELTANLKLRFQKGIYVITEGNELESQEFREQLSQLNNEDSNASPGIESQ